MKNPIMWADSKLLDGTRWIAKRYNWLTGRDNFHLARMVVLGFISGTLFLGVYDARNSLLAALSLTGILGFVLLGIVKLTEQRSCEEARRGIKEGMLTMLCAVWRMGTWFSFMVTLFDGVGGDLVEEIMARTLLGSLVVMMYLISIEKPPFKRSMAWLALKERLRTTFGELVPVPVQQ